MKIKITIMDITNAHSPNRKSIRLKEYDYSIEGLYFITICVYHFKCILGKIDEGRLILNAAGKMIELELLGLPKRFPNIQIHEYIIMPNHVHAIIEIMDDGKSNDKAANLNSAQLQNNKKALSNIIGAFKSITTKNYIQGIEYSGWTPFHHRLWQINYWDHIIRRFVSYQQIAEYITHNPDKWKEDKLFK